LDFLIDRRDLRFQTHLIKKYVIVVYSSVIHHSYKFVLISVMNGGKRDDSVDVSDEGRFHEQPQYQSDLREKIANAADVAGMALKTGLAAVALGSAIGVGVIGWAGWQAYRHVTGAEKREEQERERKCKEEEIRRAEILYQPRREIGDAGTEDGDGDSGVVLVRPWEGQKWERSAALDIVDIRELIANKEEIRKDDIDDMSIDDLFQHRTSLKSARGKISRLFWNQKHPTKLAEYDATCAEMEAEEHAEAAKHLPGVLRRLIYRCQNANACCVEVPLRSLWHSMCALGGGVMIVIPMCVWQLQRLPGILRPAGIGEEEEEQKGPCVYFIEFGLSCISSHFQLCHSYQSDSAILCTNMGCPSCLRLRLFGELVPFVYVYDKEYSLERPVLPMKSIDCCGYDECCSFDLNCFDLCFDENLVRVIINKHYRKAYCSLGCHTLDAWDEYACRRCCGVWNYMDILDEWTTEYYDTRRDNTDLFYWNRMMKPDRYIHAMASSGEDIVLIVDDVVPTRTCCVWNMISHCSFLSKKVPTATPVVDNKPELGEKPTIATIV